MKAYLFQFDSIRVIATSFNEKNMKAVKFMHETSTIGHKTFISFIDKSPV